jgi:hypothetical protein
MKESPLLAVETVSIASAPNAAAAQKQKQMSI